MPKYLRLNACSALGQWGLLLTGLMLGLGEPILAQEVGHASLGGGTTLHEHWQGMTTTWQQLERVMVQITDGLEAKYPGYLASMDRFQSHLKTCTPMQFSDPIQGVTQTIQGWQGHRCQVEFAQIGGTQQQGTCFYDRDELVGLKVQLPMPKNCNSKHLPLPSTISKF